MGIQMCEALCVRVCVCVCVCQSSLLQIWMLQAGPSSARSPPTHFQHFRSTFFFHRKATVGVYIYMHRHTTHSSALRTLHDDYHHQGSVMAEERAFCTYSSLPSPHPPRPPWRGREERKGRKDTSRESSRKVGTPWVLLGRKSLSSICGVFS